MGCGPKFSDVETRFHERFSPDDLVILGVDFLESAEVARAFADEWGATFPILLDSHASAYADYYYWCPNRFPRDFVIDPEGRIVYMACEYCVPGEDGSCPADVPGATAIAEIIGEYGITPVSEATWGSIKAMYRDPAASGR